MEAFETFEHAGCTITLHYDDDPMSPGEWDTLGTLGTLYGFDARYTGMQEAPSDVREALERGGMPLMVRHLSLMHCLHVVPFDVYEHGGVTICEASATDVTCSGYIAADAASIEMTGVPLDKIEDGLRSELREWRAFYEGNVIGYVVHAGTFPMPEDGIIVTGEDARYVANLPVLESCWGFYPDNAKHVCAIHGDVSPCYSCPKCGSSLHVAHVDEYEYVRVEARESAEHEESERAKALALGIPTVSA